MLNLKEKSSSNKPKPKRSKTAKISNKKSPKVLTLNQLAIEETKKLYQKYYEPPNPLFISQLKTDTINIYLSNFKFNDIAVINKILDKYKYAKHLTLSPIDPMKSNSKKIKNKNTREPITEGEKVKLDKEAKDKEIEFSHIINKITYGLGKFLYKNEKLESFNLLNFTIESKLAQNLSYGIINNNSIKKFRVNNCKMDIQTYEILLKGLFNHPEISELDLQKNDLGDKYGNMIGRIISRQTDRRDQVIWSFALRNEFPKDKNYKNGLIFINLNGNNLSSYSADCITTALASDQYVRSIILSNNKFEVDDCKKFIYMLRRNMTLLNIDLSSNLGYSDNIQKRLIIKMAKNIKNLYIKFKKGEIDGEEFENYKKYINSKLFFKIDIPEDVVENYNSNNKNKILDDDDDLNIEKYNNNKKENGMVIKDLNDNNNEIKIKNNILNKNKNKNIPMNQNIDKIKEDQNTKKLIEENLLLKKQILELKAENIKNKSGKNIKIPNNYKNENLNKNFKQAEELLDELNKIMNKIENDNDAKKNIDKKEIDNKKENLNDKIKIKNISLNEKKEDQIKNNNINKEKKKEINNLKEKEKKEIKLNLDDNNKINYKKDENNFNNNKNNIQYNNNINNNIIKNQKEKEKDKSDKKKEMNNNKINNKKEEIKKGKNNEILNNKKLNLMEKEEEKENEESENIDENDERMLQHQIIFEQLKRQYEAKGMKFDMEDYLELLQNPELFEEEEDENEGF